MPKNTDEFAVLSLRDLIEARDLYHFHLMGKANVVGTAVGLYLIRDSDPQPGERRPRRKRPMHKAARTFANSSVRNYSWPCIIVLVRSWQREDKFGKQLPADDFVPRQLYLPDGRAVPICVVLAPPLPLDSLPSRPAVDRPQVTFGGGLAVHVEVQHESRFATIGCLVSDGHTAYALTARHACGEPGTEVSALMRSGLRRIGESSDKQITRKLFSEVYPALPMRQTWLGLDVGLVRIDDLRTWTPNVYGLPRTGPIYDVYEQNLSLRQLIDRKVVAMGAASGVLEGEIKAMFYRYRSVGGYDYVSDFLIAPGAGQAGARHGDSGALWMIDMADQPRRRAARPLAKRKLRPLAIEWGAQALDDGKSRSAFSVATGLSNVCKLLDVELMIDDSDGLAGTWGAVGHYSIGTLAIDLVRDPVLKAFLKDNADLVSIERDELGHGVKNKALLDAGFVPLADVPDIVWKNYPSPHPNSKGVDIGVVGGRDTRSGGMRSTGPEHANHHCDADRPFAGKATLPKACLADNSLITAANWNAYFDAFPDPPNDIHRGILPFRAWQFFDRMRDYVAAGEAAEFLTAAGILAHYVGDASQPLHGSIHADGFEDEQPDAPRLSPSRKNPDKSNKPAYRGEGIHSAYESDAIDYAVRHGELFPEVLANFGADHGLALVGDGRGAAVATLKCMDEVARILPPKRIVDVYERSFVDDVSRPKALWEALHKESGEVLAWGARTLAMIWDAAWAAGGGLPANPGRQDRDTLRDLYENPNFVKSVTVDDIEHEIAHPTPL